jgi:hypothetical protein
MEVKNTIGLAAEIILPADEVATAIEAYLVAHRVVVVGPRTTKMKGLNAAISVDPSGYAIINGVKYSGYVGKVGYDDELGKT